MDQDIITHISQDPYRLALVAAGLVFFVIAIVQVYLEQEY